MAAYRLKDLVLFPNLLSVARVPLAIAFPLTAANAPLALGVLGLAGLTDLLDGWAARRMGQATPVGALVDGVADKIFAASVLGTLVASGALSPLAALLLATRELGELPLVLRVMTSPRARLTEVDRKANRLGKVATALEFATVLAVIAKAPGKTALLGATAICGAAAAVGYWRREIRAVGLEHAARRCRRRRKRPSAAVRGLAPQPRRADLRRTTRS